MRPDPRSAQAARAARTTIYRTPHPLAIDAKADRQAFRLLLLPFVAMALLLAILPALHVFPTLREVIARTPQVAATTLPPEATVATTAPDALVTIGNPTALALLETPEATLGAPRLALPAPTAVAPSDIQPPRDLAISTTQPVAATAPLAWAEPVRHAPTLATGHLHVALTHPTLATAHAAAMPVSLVRPPSSPVALALIPPPLQAAATDQRVALLSPLTAPGLLMPIPPTPYETSCQVAYGSARADALDPPPPQSSAFGVRLATAAAEQTRGFVIYDDKYRQIARSGGDVPPMYGVCTDVVVRAYRTLGVDLQVLVQASRVGAGDPNIDHRRTETLRRYFTRFGQTLPVTPFGEDYQPGDIVTYWRPQNSGSRSHIAVVAAVNGPSGNPMIIHNRGWGPQLEDGLFVDRITGHYRYDGTIRPPVPQMAATAPLRPATPIALRPPALAEPAKSRGL